MEGYFVVFDRASRQMGFAQTTCMQRSDQYISTVSGPYKTSSKFFVEMSFKKYPTY